MNDFQDSYIHGRGIKRPSMIYISATVVPAPDDPTSEASVPVCIEELYLPLSEHPKVLLWIEVKETNRILLNLPSPSHCILSIYREVHEALIGGRLLTRSLSPSPASEEDR